MTSSENVERAEIDPNSEHHGLSGLPPESYTAQRLRHASAQHLHVTSKRIFIGPIPSDWIADHRKSWARHRPHELTYPSRTATFNAADGISEFTALTGADDGNSHSVRHAIGFSQPEDIINGEPELNGTSQDIQDDTSTATLRPMPYDQAGTQVSESVVLPLPQNKLAGNAETYVTAQTRQQDSSTVLGAPAGSGAVIQSRGSSKDDRGGYLSARAEQTDVESPLTFQDDPEPSPMERKEGSSKSTQALLPPTKKETSLVKQKINPGESLDQRIQMRPSSSSSNAPRLQRNPSRRNVLQEVAPEAYQDEIGQAGQVHTELLAAGTIRFNLPDDVASKSHGMKRRVSEAKERVSGKELRRPEAIPGQLLKAERMLVRIDFSKHEIEKDYSERSSAKAETMVLEKWREYMVTCRRSNSEVGFVLDMAKTRVLPMLANRQISRNAAHRINLVPHVTRANLFSTLDKTIVIWQPTRKGTRIYTFRPRSSISSIEWLTFLNLILGWKGPQILKLSVPDLDVTLEIDSPKAQLKISHHGTEIDSLTGTDQKVRPVDSGLVENIVNKALGSLKSSEFKDLLSEWQKRDEKLGLVWRQYDRLDWVHGTHKERIYDSLAMQRTHELEIRPKAHYPTFVAQSDAGVHTHLQEPAPIEGFLIRQTSQRGQNSRMGRNFFRRFYFSTHNHLLCFSNPGRAMPPKSQQVKEALDDGSQDAKTLGGKIPLIYTVNPYPMKDGTITWMSEKNPNKVKEHDQFAYEESQRSLHLVSEAEGYINMCHIRKVKKYRPGNVDTLADAIETQDEDSQTNGENNDNFAGIEHDIQQSFELHLTNGLTIRLQAYDKEARKEWVRTLRELSAYWKLRTAADIDLYKEVRRQNLDSLGIDEEMESIVGQSAEKWEVSKSIASPELYHMCGISSCRQITVKTTPFD